MEIAVNAQSVSFYHNSETLYATVEVYEKKILDEKHTCINYFNTVRLQQKVNLIYRGSDVLEVLQQLFNRVIRIRIDSVEQPKDPTKGIKYIISGIEKCVLLRET